MAIRVYNYACRVDWRKKVYDPATGKWRIELTPAGQLLDEQFRLAFKYKKELFRLHAARLAEYNQILFMHFPEYERCVQQENAAQQRVEELTKSIKEENRTARRKRASEQEADEFKLATEAAKAATKARQECYARIKNEDRLKPDLELLNIKFSGEKIDPDKPRRRGGLFKEARAACGVYWGTYLRVEAAIEAALEATSNHPREPMPGDKTAVAVSISPKINWGSVVQGRNQFIQWVGHRDRGKKAPHVRMKIRVKSDEKRQPIWLEFTATMDRKLPDDARISNVAFVRTSKPAHRLSDGNVHPMYDWAVQFTVETSESKPRGETGICGVDLGWRLMDSGGLRVLYWVGSDGRHGELQLPQRLLTAFEHAASIQSISDNLFNEVVAKVTAFRVNHLLGNSGTTVPDWWLEATEFASRWKSHLKLIILYDKWKQTRFVGDDDLFNEVEAWRYRALHLYQYRKHEEAKAIRRRQALYLQTLAKLRQEYQTLVFEDVNWREMAEKVASKFAPFSNDYEASRRMMRIAAIGFLKARAMQDGAILVNPAYGTKQCYVCGTINEFDAEKNLCHKCVKCGTTWDQDHNACINYREDGRKKLAEAAKEAAAAEEKKSYKGKWQRRKEEKAKKSQPPTDTDAVVGA